MHYIWRYRLLPPGDCVTVDGERVVIIDPGQLNTDSGPDFFNAKVQIGDKMWCGNVEMHLRASDWHRHGHHKDDAYSSVILHVVERNDTRINMHDGTLLPQMVMKCPENITERYNALTYRDDGRLPCCGEIGSLHPVFITDWLTALAFTRLERKVQDVKDIFSLTGNRWPETVFVTLAQGLGFHTNSQPMRLLALSTPLRALMKHRDNQAAVEGLLFGRAGFLSDTLLAKYPDDRYIARMKAEYDFLNGKFSLPPAIGIQWKTARMRPPNFPHRRIATLAAMITADFNIANDIFAVKTVDEAMELFRFDISGYWAHRYSFSSCSAPSSRAMTDTSAKILIINVVAPLLYAYGELCHRADIMHTAMSLMEQLPPENNNVTRCFIAAGIPCKSALDSQAMIELRRQYCELRKCIYCRLGHKFLAANKSH